MSSGFVMRKRKNKYPARVNFARNYCLKYGVFVFTFLVRLTGLEPARLPAPEPKSGVSANFTTGAYRRPL